MTKISDRIKYIREYFGLTVEEFAQRLDVATNAVVMWESGDYNPGQTRMDVLCEKFKVSPDWLFHGNEPMLKEDVGIEAKKIRREFARQIIDCLPAEIQRLFFECLQETLSCRQCNDTPSVVNQTNIGVVNGDVKQERE